MLASWEYEGLPRLSVRDALPSCEALYERDWVVEAVVVLLDESVGDADRVEEVLSVIDLDEVSSLVAEPNVGESVTLKELEEESEGDMVREFDNDSVLLVDATDDDDTVNEPSFERLPIEGESVTESLRDDVRELLPERE